MKNKQKMKMIRKSFSFNPHPDFSNISKNKTHALNQERKKKPSHMVVSFISIFYKLRDPFQPLAYIYLLKSPKLYSNMHHDKHK